MRFDSTVRTVTNSAAATSLFVRPSATSSRHAALGGRELVAARRPSAEPAELGPSAVGPDAGADSLEELQGLLEGRSERCRRCPARLYALPSATSVRPRSIGTGRRSWCPSASSNDVDRAIEIAPLSREQPARASGGGEHARPLDLAPELLPRLELRLRLLEPADPDQRLDRVLVGQERPGLTRLRIPRRVETDR